MTVKEDIPAGTRVRLLQHADVHDRPGNPVSSVTWSLGTVKPGDTPSVKITVRVWAASAARSATWRRSRARASPARATSTPTASAPTPRRARIRPGRTPTAARRPRWCGRICSGSTRRSRRPRARRAASGPTATATACSALPLPPSDGGSLLKLGPAEQHEHKPGHASQRGPAREHGGDRGREGPEGRARRLRESRPTWFAPSRGPCERRPTRRTARPAPRSRT